MYLSLETKDRGAGGRVSSWSPGARRDVDDIGNLEEGVVVGMLDELAEGLRRVDHAGVSSWSPGARRDVSSAVIGRVEERKRTLPRSVP